MEVLMGIAAVIAVFFGIRWILLQQWKQQRRAELMKKYGNESIVDAILARKFWQGQTREQLLDALGRPVDIDEKVMRSKVRQTWKYVERGKGRYALRVVLEQDIVVGWEQRG